MRRLCERLGPMSRLRLAALCLTCLLLSCAEEDPAPGIRATCERLEALCGEELLFDAAQCEAEAMSEPQPTKAERRCVERSEDCAEAMDCQYGADGGTPDAG